MNFQIINGCAGTDPGLETAGTDPGRRCTVKFLTPNAFNLFHDIRE